MCEDEDELFLDDLEWLIESVELPETEDFLDEDDLWEQQEEDDLDEYVEESECLWLFSYSLSDSKLLVFLRDFDLLQAFDPLKWPILPQAKHSSFAARHL